MISELIHAIAALDRRIEETISGGQCQFLSLAYTSYKRSYTTGTMNHVCTTVSRRCLATSNMANCWNAHEPLRNAKTIGEARSAARKLANTMRHK